MALPAEAVSEPPPLKIEKKRLPTPCATPVLSVTTQTIVWRPLPKASVLNVKTPSAVLMPG